MQFITEFMVAIFLGTYLLIIDPVMTIVMGVLLVGITLISTAFLKPRISRIGEESRQQQSKMYKTIMQSINSVKDVKVYGKEDAFLGIYRKYGKRYYNLARDHEVLSSVPRLAIEAFSLSGVLAYMAVMMKLGQDVQTMVPQLSAFAVAAVRLLPSASRINTYLANIAYYRPTLDYVYANVELPQHVDERAAEAKLAVTTDKLAFTIASGWRSYTTNTRILKNIFLKMRRWRFLTESLWVSWDPPVRERPLWWMSYWGY